MTTESTTESTLLSTLLETARTHEEAKAVQAEAARLKREQAKRERAEAKAKAKAKKDEAEEAKAISATDVMFGTVADAAAKAMKSGGNPNVTLLMGRLTDYALKGAPVTVPTAPSDPAIEAERDTLREQVASLTSDHDEVVAQFAATCNPHTTGSLAQQLAAVNETNRNLKADLDKAVAARGQAEADRDVSQAKLNSVTELVGALPQIDQYQMTLGRGAVKVPFESVDTFIDTRQKLFAALGLNELGLPERS